MRWRWQNLNEKYVRGEKRARVGNGFKQGRAWLYLRDEYPASFEIEWCWAWRNVFALRIAHSSASCAALGLALYFTFASKWNPLRLVPKPRIGGQFNCYYSEWALWFAAWEREMEWRSSDSWWRKMHVLHFDDLLLGCRKHSEEILVPTRTVLVPMLEGAYEAQAHLERNTWKRSRWPWWPVKIVRELWDFKFTHGIPHHGKGENSWDCGEDALCGLAVEADTLAEAIGIVAGRGLASRVKRGGERYLTEPWEHSARTALTHRDAAKKE